MSLLDSLVGEVSKKTPAAKNRVAILLDKLQGTEDYDVLVSALNDPAKFSHAALTRALEAEYGEGAVKKSSVREYRLNNSPRTVNGL